MALKDISKIHLRAIDWVRAATDKRHGVQKALMRLTPWRSIRQPPSTSATLQKSAPTLRAIKILKPNA
jgi:hypothetical protein